MPTLFVQIIRGFFCLKSSNCLGGNATSRKGDTFIVLFLFCPCTQYNIHTHNTFMLCVRKQIRSCFHYILFSLTFRCFSFVHKNYLTHYQDIVVITQNVGKYNWAMHHIYFLWFICFSAHRLVNGASNGFVLGIVVSHKL